MIKGIIILKKKKIKMKLNNQNEEDNNNKYFEQKEEKDKNEMKLLSNELSKIFQDPGKKKRNIDLNNDIDDNTK